MHVVSHHLKTNYSYDTIKYYKILFQLLNIIVLVTHKYNYRTEIYIELKNIYRNRTETRSNVFITTANLHFNIFHAQFISLPECYL